MKRNFKIIATVLLVVAVFVAGILLTRWYYDLGKINREEQATVLLDRIKTVTKLVVLEGFFSEIYDYQDYYGFDLSFFRKKALITVQAKVSVGFDLDKLNIETDAASKTVRMSAIPAPEILSMDHNLDYYDIQEGAFNSFSPADYNRLNDKAKDFVRNKAKDSDLFTRALERRDDIYSTIRFLVEGMGWTLKIDQEPSIAEPTDSAKQRRPGQ